MNKHPHPGKDPSEANRLVAEARQHFSAGRPDQAEALLRGVLEQNPREMQAIVALGIVAAETGRPEMAISQMSRALEIDPRCVPAMCWMSFLHLQTGKLGESQAYAAKAAEIDPRNPAAHAALGRSLMQQGKAGEAIPSLQRAAQLNPNNATTLYELTDALLAGGFGGEATETLRRAVALAPDTLRLLRLALLELRYGQVDEAEKYARRALRREPDHPAGQLVMARVLTERGQTEEAEPYWRRAEELDPGGINLEKALALSAIGEFDSAVVELRKSLESNPIQGSAYQALTYSKRLVEDDRPLIGQMEQALAHGGLPDKEVLHLLYSLGKAHDNLGEFDAAIKYFDRANALKRQIAGNPPFDRAACQALVDDKIRLFTKSFFSGHRRDGSESDLPISIVGMMRSGTTLAEQMLTCHPMIGGAGEQPFWGEHDRLIVDYGRQTVDTGRMKTAANQYVELLSSLAPGVPHVIDKNPANLQVVGSLHMALPRSRIIHTRRNAVDTAISIWTTPMDTNAGFIGDRENIVFAYKQFIRLMDHWLTVVPPECLLEVRYEDLVCEPESHGRRMVAFLGLEWDEAMLHPEANRRRVRTPSLWQVRQPVYKTSMERWKNYEPWLGPFAELAGMS